jgi:probable lipoprotein NlpC
MFSLIIISVGSVQAQTALTTEANLPYVLNNPGDWKQKESEGMILLIANALSWLGTPYQMGGMSRNGVDCSGFVNRVIAYTFQDITGIPRRSEDFGAYGLIVSDIQPGDILLFAQNGSVFHVGIALSDTFFIHAASEGSRTGVIVSNLKDGMWKNYLYGVRRIGY